jgi:nucleoside-diphosphate-sugar epimerase
LNFEQIKPRSILINGANGALGKALIGTLPRSLTRPAARRPLYNEEDWVLVETDGSVLSSCLKGVEVIFNCAGRASGTREDIWQSNVEHPLRLAKLAKEVGVKHFVQVSSFSIFGRCEFIDADSKLNPRNDYGESKVEAEIGLGNLMTEKFKVTNIRLPFMFGSQNKSQMEKLVGLLGKLPAFPVASIPIKRSMLTYTDAAELLCRAGLMENPGSINIADPQLFTMELLFDLMVELGETPAQLIKMPDFVSNSIKYFVPKIGERLFENSVLCPSINWAKNVKLKIGIVNELRELVRTSQRRLELRN